MTTHVRIEAVLKATGRAEFEAETYAPGMLHAALVEAPIPCAEVRTVDLAPARVVPGVVEAVSYAEAEFLHPSPFTRLIQEPHVHFAGQPVALIAAESLLQARAGARAAAVQYAPQSAVTHMRQAPERAYAPELALRQPAATRRGDVEAGLQAAALTVRQSYATEVNNHHPMEPHAVVAWWEGDRAVIHTCTQAVFFTQRITARAFGIPIENVRVVARFLGGGFGCKGDLWWPWMLWTLIAAKRAGRPVRLELSRAQLFTLAGRRQETEQDLALGFDRDGRLTAIDHEVLGQTSTHAEYADCTANVSRWLYACPNVATRHRIVPTNEPHPAPMRAPGVAPGLFALESALDEAAWRLGIDPVELRVRNFADRDQQNGRPWSSNSLRECYSIAAERFGWAARRAEGQGSDGRWRLGWGMASCCYPAHRANCRARLILSPDGGLLVQCGTQDMGSGTYTALAQVAAETLGVNPDVVRVELGDTDLPEGPISAGSMVTASFAPAVEQAGAALRTQLASCAVADPASPLAGHDPADLVVAEGRIFSRAGNVGEPLSELMARRAEPLSADGAFTMPTTEEKTGMGFGAVFVEVGVDPDRGEVRVRRVTAAFAAGRILNPLLAESQYVGGLVGGIGQALHERTVTDRTTGRILGDGFADYLIPVHADMPDFDVVMVPEEERYLPGGVKGVGMLGTAGVQAAVANAVFHAVGTRVRRLPIRIEDLLGGGASPPRSRVCA
jgi:xanthine dehydrogenase YagR molybdenum-binding subunit